MAEGDREPGVNRADRRWLKRAGRGLTPDEKKKLYEYQARSTEIGRELAELKRIVDEA